MPKGGSTAWKKNPPPPPQKNPPPPQKKTPKPPPKKRKAVSQNIGKKKKTFTEGQKEKGRNGPRTKNQRVRAYERKEPYFSRGEKKRDEKTLQKRGARGSSLRREKLGSEKGPVSSGKKGKKKEKPSRLISLKPQRKKGDKKN